MLVYSPFLAYQVLILVDELSLKSGFSEVPSYSQTLLPGDTRLNATISLDQFIKEADKATSKDVEENVNCVQEEGAGVIERRG